MPTPAARPVGESYWVLTLYASLALVTAAALVVALIERDEALAAVGGIGLVTTLATLPVALVVRREARAQTAELARRIHDLAAAVDRLSEQQALSDDARRVINRARERNILRRAIEEDLAAGDWSAADTLVHELADRFGYRADAEEFRARIDLARATDTDRKVSDAVQQLDLLVGRRDWPAALAEADRIARLFPDSPRAASLPRRIEDARNRYKHELERRFLNAATEERLDDAMELLKQLDHYLTESEAEPYVELARGVIGKARENLGVQFKIAIQDKDFRRAASVGERIIQNFPNTRMAAEVRGMIESLREHARAQHLATAPHAEASHPGAEPAGPFPPA